MKVEKKVNLLVKKLRDLKPDPRAMNIKFVSKSLNGDILVDYKDSQESYPPELSVDELVEEIMGQKVEKPKEANPKLLPKADKKVTKVVKKPKKKGLLARLKR